MKRAEADAGHGLRASLGGTGQVADDLWLMAHHEISGRPFLGPRPLGIGLAGGLLAELMLSGCVIVGFDGAVVARPFVPRDGLARQVRDQIAAEPERHPLPDWLLFLSRVAADGVASRLERAGYLTRSGGRGPWRAPRWVPVDPDWAFAALTRARPATAGAQQASAHAVVLAGLAVGCGLRFRLDQYLPDSANVAEKAVAQLTPDLRKLIAAIRQAVDRSVLAQRM
jgi:Golgi phosphoprotein 3 (GPP34)